MTVDLVSLTMIMLVAAFCPIVTQMIPGKVVPQTVLLLLAGALMGPHMGQVIDVDQSIELLSELGLAFLFLLAGYEIDPKELTGHQARLDSPHGWRRSRWRQRSSRWCHISAPTT